MIKMKVSFSHNLNLHHIDSLPCGTVVVTPRKSAKDELGVYLIVDRDSGLTPNLKDKILAVNLKTGQLRGFTPTAMVEPRDEAIVEL